MSTKPVKAVAMVRVADVLDVPVVTARSWIRRGVLPGAFIEHSFPIKANARWMIPLADATELLNQRRVDPKLLDGHIEDAWPAEAEAS